MKTEKFETSFENLTDYLLSDEEMITVRGGNEGDPVVPIGPPIRV
jgi:hypothetical protein